ncbi:MULTISPECIES: hemerythrin domain-containing protein [unclassified Shinella]|uniref:hemerythrin domain-containing protein n=1 Tax=unclassified Shinella TaxID=2643062 RepID=UPI00234EE6BE|nr:MULTISPECIES: hemerythrin domain-containing protein [unclassified Shinella]MCO5153145.1 hemerythrin domain-containing protein [Shinella sp.]MDC7263574.1 hemerythrin domain-containing protein [Shinella sp. HY16]MDC7270469.1 hemerythrin domain-containing protein [Shinella sp. YZ44]
MDEPTLNAADIGRLETLHQALLGICLRLEEAASEPGTASELQALAEAIPPALKAVHELEERLLFPDFDRHAGSCFAAMAIERLKAEHRCDRLAAEELALTLKAVANGRCGLSPETVSRMIGGFQESLRRHVFSEQMILETLLAAKAEARDVFA